MPTDLIKQVAEFCWSNKFLDIFRKFFMDHAEMFMDAPDVMEGGEHNVEFYDLFQDYLVVYENTLTSYLRTLDCPIDQFYREVRQAQNETNDKYLLTFIDCLLASCDYDSFYKVMVKEARRRAVRSVDMKAEGKGNDDDDDEDEEDYRPSAKSEGKSSYK